MAKLTWEEAERRAYLAGDLESVRIITDTNTPSQELSLQECHAYITGDTAKAKLLAAKIDNAPTSRLKGTDMCTREQFVMAIHEGYDTLPKLMEVLSLTKSQAKHLRDTLVVDEVIEPYAQAPSTTRGQRLFCYRIVKERRGSGLTREGHTIVQSAIQSLQGHSGPFAVLLSTSGASHV